MMIIVVPAGFSSKNGEMSVCLPARSIAGTRWVGTGCRSVRGEECGSSGEERGAKLTARERGADCPADAATMIRMIRKSLQPVRRAARHDGPVLPHPRERQCRQPPFSFMFMASVVKAFSAKSLTPRDYVRHVVASVVPYVRHARSRLPVCPPPGVGGSSRQEGGACCGVGGGGYRSPSAACQLSVCPWFIRLA